MNFRTNRTLRTPRTEELSASFHSLHRGHADAKCLPKMSIGLEKPHGFERLQKEVRNPPLNSLSGPMRPFTPSQGPKGTRSIPIDSHLSTQCVKPKPLLLGDLHESVLIPKLEDPLAISTVPLRRHPADLRRLLTVYHVWPLDRSIRPTEYMLSSLLTTEASESDGDHLTCRR